MPRRIGIPSRIAALCLAMPLALALASCSAHASSRGSVQTQPGSAYRGDELARPQALTAADLAIPFTSSGRSAALGPTTLATVAERHPLLLLYFGYTNCPDECPTTMADLALALRQSSAAIRAHVQVVFVTSDPRRDTPAVLARWLANFDVGLPVPFLGLTGSVAQTDALATSVGVPIAAPVLHADGSEDVEHGTQVLAFEHRVAHLVWLADTPPADYAADLARLLASSP